MKTSLWLVDLTDNDVARILEIRDENTVLILSDYRLHIVSIQDSNRYKIYHAESPEELLAKLGSLYSFD